MTNEYSIVELTGERLTMLPPEAWPSVEHLITEDDTPVDNIFSEKQQRLLTESLYTSWEGPGEGRPFVALANVGLFYDVNKPPLVPDMLLSLDVEAPADVWKKINRSYFVWRYGKPPDVVIEVVSNQKGGEEDKKLQRYAEIGIRYYVIFDPSQQLSHFPLRVYRKYGQMYRKFKGRYLPGIGLGLQLWQGVYAGMDATWLRWYDKQGNPIATGEEQRQRAERERQRAERERQHTERVYQQAMQEHQRAEQERQRAEHANRQAEQERQRAEQERQRAERLAARLRELGILETMENEGK